MSPRRCSVDMGMRYGKELSVREEWPFKTHPFPRDSRAQADLRRTVTLFFSNYTFQTSTFITKYFLIGRS